MKGLNKFYNQNSEKVSPINTDGQSSFKGGRFAANSFDLPSKPIRPSVPKSKFFSSFAELRASFLGGK
ncbi:MAG: hypothetical protein AB8B69_01425 [Chitinophagales bacterium]